MPSLKFIDVSTENGQVLVCLFLILLACGMHSYGWPTAGDTLFAFSIGILGRSMGTGNGNLKGTNLTVQPAPGAPSTPVTLVDAKAPAAVS